MATNELQNVLESIRTDKNSNLKPNNLKKGINCLGVVGTLDGGTDTEDADAVPKDIKNGKTAYVKGKKITGTAGVVVYNSVDGQTSNYNSQFIPLNDENNVFYPNCTAYTYRTVDTHTEYFVLSKQIMTNSQPDNWMVEGNRKIKMGISKSKIIDVLTSNIKCWEIRDGRTIVNTTGTWEPDVGDMEVIAKQILGKPVRYKRLEYICSDGGYINTGVKVNSNTKVQIKHLSTNNAAYSLGFTFVLGMNESYNDNKLWQYGFNFDTYLNPSTGKDIRGRFPEIRTSGKRTIASPEYSLDNTKYILDNSEKAYELEIGKDYIKDLTNNTIIAQQPVANFDYSEGNCLGIFGCWQSDNDGYNKPRTATLGNSCKIYYLKIYDGNMLIRDFIPVATLNENNECLEVGLYCNITKQFYGAYTPITSYQGSTYGEGVIYGADEQGIIYGK